MKNISISEKLIFYFVTLGIVVIVIIGSYTYFFAKKALLERTFDQLISLRVEKKYRIEQFFVDRSRDINLISKSEEVKNIIAILNSEKNADTHLSAQSYTSYLNKYIGSHGYYQRLFVTNAKAKVLDISNSEEKLKPLLENDSNCNQNLRDFCRRIKKEKKTIVQDLTKTQLLIYIGSPVFDANMHLIGIVVLEIPLTAINNIMFGLSSNNGLGNSGETYLVGKDYLMRSNSRFKEDAVLNLKVNSNSVKSAFQGKTGIEIVKDYRNIQCLSSYSTVNIEGLNWAIMAEIDQQEAMVPVYRIRNSILLISIIIAGSVFIFAFLIARKITQPIKKLQKASEAVSAGNYSMHLEITSLDEIGALTETFNTMISHLKAQKNEIEEEKTKRFNALIDGQEMERQRLSRDLHDSLGQSILAVKIKLEQTKNSNQEKNQQIIAETQDLLKSTIQEIRHISNDLMPPVLEAFGIEHGLKNLCKDTSVNTSINVDFICENIPETVEKRLQIYIYRISQEAINNITKHSTATSATLKLRFKSGSIHLIIADNGKGFDLIKNNNSGNGILNMKQRVELLNGEFSILSSPQKGTLITIKIPFKNDEQD